MTLSVFWIGVLVLSTSLLAPFAFRPLLHRWGVVDIPNERSSHSVTTLRAGGLAPLAGWLVGVALLCVSQPQSAWNVGIIGVTAATLAGLGFADDLRGLHALPRLGMQVGIAVLGAIAGALVTQTLTWWFIPFGVLFIVGYVNAANFMDGVNALSSLHGTVAGIVFAASGVVSERPWLVGAGVVIAAAFLSFLPWNLGRAGFFLGDVGSYLLGGSIAASGLIAIAEGVPALLIIAPLFVYIADTGVTILRRLARGENITSAHRTHAYQQLTDTGMSHFGVSAVIAGISAASGVIGLLGYTGFFDWRVTSMGIGGLAAVFILLPRWRGHRPVQRPSGDLGEVEMPDLAPSRPGFVARSWVVLGSTGFVGSALVTHLRTIGTDQVSEVRAPRLSLDPSASEPHVVARVAEASHERDTLAATFEGADVVINAAGLATPDAPGDGALYGANALLPALVASAAQRAGVPRVIHLSSAAVQGNRPELDVTLDASPFSPYSRSKALGERSFLAVGSTGEASQVPRSDLVVLRATSVQGEGRPTTKALQRMASSWMSSVAAPGSQPSVVSSIIGLVDVVTEIGTTHRALPPIILQPWEGLSAAEVLRSASGRDPLVLPRWLCKVVIAMARSVGRVVPKVAGVSRRVELMWLGQGQKARDDAVLFSPTPVGSDALRKILRDANADRPLERNDKRERTP